MTASRQGGSEPSRMCRDRVSRVPEAPQDRSPVASAVPLDVPVTPKSVRRLGDPRSIRWVSLPPRLDQQAIDDQAVPFLPAGRQEYRRQLDAEVKERPGGGAAFRSLWPCQALDGHDDRPTSPGDALRHRLLADPNSARVTPIATGVAAAADTLAHHPHHVIRQTGADHSQSFRLQGAGSQETDEFGVRPARRSREHHQGLALPVKIVGQPNRVTACFIPADAPSPGNCDNRGQSQIEVTCQRANGLGKMRRTRRQDERYHHLSRIPANRTAMCRPGGGSGSEVVIRPSARASVGKREVKWLVPCAFQNPRLDDGLGPKSIRPPGGLVHQHVSAGARNSLKQQNAARPEGFGDQRPGPQPHPVEMASSSGENRLDDILGMGRHARRGSRPLHGKRWQSPFPDKPSSPPLVEATAQLHHPSSSWGCSAAESRCRA